MSLNQNLSTHRQVPSAQDIPKNNNGPHFSADLDFSELNQDFQDTSGVNNNVLHYVYGS